MGRNVERTRHVPPEARANPEKIMVLEHVMCHPRAVDFEPQAPDARGLLCMVVRKMRAIDAILDDLLGVGADRPLFCRME